MIDVNLIIKSSVDLDLRLCAVTHTGMLMEAMAAVLKKLRRLPFT